VTQVEIDPMKIESMEIDPIKIDPMEIDPMEIGQIVLLINFKDCERIAETNLRDRL